MKMPVNLNVTIGDEAHELLQKIKSKLNLRNNSEAVDVAINLLAVKHGLKTIAENPDNAENSR